MTIFNVFTLIGGLALFLFGMDIMGKSLEKQAGSQLSKILEKLTSSPTKGFFLGLIVTAVIQSSSATTVMVVGFVNSGIMSLRQAIGIILGSNVGTTVTSWILSLTGIESSNFFVKMLKPSSFAPILAFIGIILYMSAKKDKTKTTGTILLGFAILMTGMDTMSGAVKPLASMPEFTAMFTAFSNPLLGIAVGAGLTALLQSSSASVGILQALATTGAINFSSALPIIMGQNIGTCITAIISSVGANKNAKRAAAVHLYFNVIGTVLFLVGFYTLNSFIHFSFIDSQISVAGIAVVHTVFNIIATAIMLPFSKVLEKLALMTIKDDKEEESFELLDERLIATPYVAVQRSTDLINKMANLSFNGILDSIKLFDNYNEDVVLNIAEKETTVDLYEDNLGTYLVQLSRQDLTENDSYEVSKMLHIIGDLERLSDHSVSLSKTAKEISDKNINFSIEADSELTVLTAALVDMVNRTQTAFINNDVKVAISVEPLEKVVEDLIKKIKSNHIQRLKDQNCTIELGFVLSDLLTNYKRIGDHCSNIAIAVAESDEHSFAPHEFMKNYRNNENTEFLNMYNLEKQKYSF